MQLAVNCYARIKATGKVGRITNKYRNSGRVTWGIAWSDEFPSLDLERITPATYHASADHLKIVSYATAI